MDIVPCGLKFPSDFNMRTEVVLLVTFMPSFYQFCQVLAV